MDNNLSPALGGTAAAPLPKVTDEPGFWDLSKEEQQERIKPKWNQFCAEYKALLEKYNVELDFGCGCCSHGHRMDGAEPEYYLVSGMDSI